VLQLVIDCDAERITPSCMNGWSRILPVDEEADLVATSCLVACAVGQIEGVADGVSRGREFLRDVSVGIENWCPSMGLSHEPDRNLSQY
jgi:hypothetical protein